MLRLTKHTYIRLVKPYGGKALGLLRLIKAQCRVPETYVLGVNDSLPVIPSLTGLWAVRSCAPNEDGKGASYAGQHKTLLNVEPEDLPAAVEEVRQSGSGSDEYSRAMGQSPVGKINVIVQAMVRDPIWSGVTFTGDPDTGNRSTIVIEAVQGLGDKLVGGEVDPEWSVKVPDDAISDTVNALGYSSAQLKILKAIVLLKRKLEPKFGGPLDLEWAADHFGPFFLQARPITAVQWHVTGEGLGFGQEPIVGKVRRVNMGTPGTAVKPGEILVTHMTDPNMVNAMVRSGGIVTEVGGRLCHAAIVARELGKPCVVGCKAAAGLYNGDKIKLDPVKGTFELVE